MIYYRCIFDGAICFYLKWVEIFDLTVRKGGNVVKKRISKQLALIIAIVFVAVSVFNYFRQVDDAELSEQTRALATISKIEDILTANDEELALLTLSMQEEYLVRVKSVTYILQNMDINTPEEFEQLAEMLEVDEIHMFTEDGVIYGGSEPKYYGFSFDSGEQMEFFKPMLDDKELSLCQDITPNTAEGKYMMYVATWMEDGSEIVQIGLEPSRVLAVQDSNTLDNIFAAMPTDGETMLFAVDQSSGVIFGCSEDEYLGCTAQSIGISLNHSIANGDVFYSTVNGVEQMCVFTVYEDIYIGQTVNKTVIDQTIWQSMLAVSCYILVVAVLGYI